MAAEAPFVLQVEDEGSELIPADRCHIGGQALGLEVVMEVGYAVDDDIYGHIGLALGTGVELVSWDEIG
jgi:hypothetical protein